MSEFLFDKLGWKEKKGEEMEREEADERASTAAKSVAGESVKKSNEIFEYQNRADLIIHDTSSSAQLRIAECEDKAELGGWLKWAKGQIASVPKTFSIADRQLSTQLIKQWVLEHAASTKQASKGTNPKAWKEARDDLKKEGDLDLERTDLFVHQCRHEWGSLGLVETENQALRLDIDRKRAEAWGLGLGNAREDLGGVVINQLNDPLLTFRRSEVPDIVRSVFSSVDRPLEPKRAVNAIAGGFGLDCKVKLVLDGTGVRVQRFEYTLRYRDADGMHETYLERSP